MKPLLPAIVGPTASGKTDAALQVAEHRRATIISADSRQIYRRFNIGTSKPPREVLERVPHRFIDLLEPHEQYSAGQFEMDATQAVVEILRLGSMPLVVGGTGMYVRALLRGLFKGPGKNEEFRAELEERLALEGEQSLMEELRRIDPEAAESTEKGKPRRLIRALEVYYLTGRSITEHHRLQGHERLFRPLIFGLEVPRRELYNRIDSRVDRMMEEGLVEEVRSLIASSVSKDAPGFNTVGYKEVLMHLDGEISEEEMVRLIKRNTRRYAKRQMTWFRGEKDIEWVDASAGRSASEIASDIEERIELAMNP